MKLAVFLTGLLLAAAVGTVTGEIIPGPAGTLVAFTLGAGCGLLTLLALDALERDR